MNFLLQPKNERKKKRKNWEGEKKEKKKKKGKKKKKRQRKGRRVRREKYGKERVRKKIIFDKFFFFLVLCFADFHSVMLINLTLSVFT